MTLPVPFTVSPFVLDFPGELDGRFLSAVRFQCAFGPAIPSGSAGAIREGHENEEVKEAPDDGGHQDDLTGVTPTTNSKHFKTLKFKDKLVFIKNLCNDLIYLFCVRVIGQISHRNI